MSKADLRQVMRKKCSDKDQRRDSLALLFNRLQDLLQQDSLEVVGAYYPRTDEVDLSPLYEKDFCWTFPYFTTGNREMTFHISSDSESEEFFFQGKGALRASRNAPVKKPQVVFIPGVAFDLQGNRLGRGGGYYDYYLAEQNPQALRVAIAYDFQVVENLPCEDHDQKMDYLFTSTQIYKFFRSTV